MTVDLHVHTTASDGTVAPVDIVRAALDLGLTVISITDHDSIEGVDEAIAAARGTALEVLPGVELSVRGDDGSDVHLLGYLIDHRDVGLLTALERLRAARFERAAAMVAGLAEAGHRVELQDVLGHAAGGAVGRVHVARALVEAGSVTTIEQAFAELIGREGPFYVRKAFFSAQEALALIHGAGGVAVLAHPGVTGEGALIPLVELGLDGVEAYHAEHTPAQRAHFASLAKRFGLVTTGGSDFHGPNMRSAGLGAGACPPPAVEALRERATIVRP
ncbi:MAG TPA: PHP domain-containing protein [Coriobacteriia bacterium]